jgi:hypothetical protein
VHLDPRLINMPTRTWTRFQKMSYQLMLRKMSPHKTEITGDDGTTIVPPVGGTRLHELIVPQHPMDHITYDETSAKQPTLPLAAH